MSAFVAWLLDTTLGRALLIVVTVAVTATVAYQIGASKGWGRGYQAATLEYTAQIEKDRERSEREAREAEEKHRSALREVAQTYEKEKRDAQQAALDVADDLRSGNRRLRALWRGCENAAARVPATAGAAAEPDGAARLREEAAGRIVGVGAEADAHVRGLQEALKICSGTR